MVEYRWRGKDVTVIAMIETFPWIAVVDDEEPIRRSLLRLMRSVGINAQAFASGGQFLDFIQACKPKCVVLDLNMPGMTGFEVQDRLVRDAPDIQIIILTAQDSPQAYGRAMLARPIAYLKKPIDSHCLLGAIDQALKTKLRLPTAGANKTGRMPGAS
jgi:FixJ family two-component response regulator